MRSPPGGAIRLLHISERGTTVPEKIKKFDKRNLGKDTLDASYYPRISLRGTSTGGVGFGDNIVDSSREYAIQREPIAKRMVVDVAYSITKNWFSVDNPDTDHPDPDVDLKVQAVLGNVNAKTVMTFGIKYERLYGKSVILMGFDDADSLDGLKKEVAKTSNLVDLWAYPKTAIGKIILNEDMGSPTYGTPLYFWIKRGEQTLICHASRVIYLNLREGVSVLDPVWDDLTCLRNIRWGMSQTMYRYGSGFPVITAKGATYKQLQDMADDNRIKSLMSRTYFLKNESMEIDFKGAEGAALNPTAYYLPIMESISCGSNIPLAILRGAQAGALTGSEVNEREYASYIREQQSLLDYAFRKLVGYVLNSEEVNLPLDNYVIRWKSGLELSEKDSAELALAKEQAQKIRMSYMTLDEVRGLANLDPIGGEEGARIAGVTKEQNSSPFGGLETDEIPWTADQKRQQGPHSQLVNGLKSIITQVQTNSLREEGARFQARQLIQKYFDFEVQAAKDFIFARTGKRVVTLPTAAAKKMEVLKSTYLDDFEGILKDAIKGSNPDRNKVKTPAKPK